MSDDRMSGALVLKDFSFELWAALWRRKILVQG